MAFRVLFLCTGNVCRSPAAELIFSSLAAGHDIACASAGTAGLTGQGVDGPTALALKELGIDPSAHEARRITAGLVTAADLILTATEEHRATVLRENPLAFRKVFTLREFGRLGADLGPLAPRPEPEALIERVRLVADQRGEVDPPLPGGDDIGDPFGGGLDVARLAVLQVRDATARVLTALGLPAPVFEPSDAPPAEQD